MRTRPDPDGQQDTVTTDCDALGRLPTRVFVGLVAAVAALSFAVRLGLRAAHGVSSYWQEGYRFFHELAIGIASGKGYVVAGQPTAFRVPGYPLFIAAVTGGNCNAWALITAQALVGTATVIASAILARRLYGEQAGIVAGLICALLPYQAWHDTALQETGLFTCLVLVGTIAVFALQRNGKSFAGLAAGALLGMAILVRATVLPFALLALAWTVFVNRRAALSAGLGLAAMGVVLSPWLVRAHAITGHYGLGTEFGWSLYAGNHSDTFAAYPERSIDESRALIYASHTPAERAELAALGKDEVALDRWYRDRAIANIMSNPGAFVAGMGRKLWAAFGPLPSPRHDWLTDGVYAASWVPLIVLAFAGMWRRRRCWQIDMIVYLQIGCFIGVTALVWAHTSHRSFLDPILAAYAAGPALALLNRMATAMPWWPRRSLP